MTNNFVKYIKTVKNLSFNIIGWSLLILLWYNFLFDSKCIHSTLTAVKISSFWVITLFILYFIWSSFNIKNLFHTYYKSLYIRIKVKDWTWAEATLDENDNIIKTNERFVLICKQKNNTLSSAKMHSYSAILIRDGCIKEAIGFIRPIINDPYIGQLRRKIAEGELNIIFEDSFLINNPEE